jgi:hypothetical protein
MAAHLLAKEAFQHDVEKIWMNKCLWILGLRLEKQNYEAKND